MSSELQTIITLLNDAKEVFKAKYWNMKEAQRRTSLYETYRVIQNEWANAPLKKIARLQEFVNANKDL